MTRASDPTANLDRLIPGSEAAWVGLTVPERERSPSPFVRGTVSLETVPRTATLHWTALGLAEIHVNGRRVGDDRFVPGWTDFHRRAQVLRYDVSGFLIEGENVVGAVLGDGWYCGYLGFAGQRELYGTEPRFLASLEADRGRGAEIVLETGAGWEAATGPVLNADIYHGEAYDARRELGDWSAPGASRDGWGPAEVFPPYAGVLQTKRVPPVRVTEELEPVAIRETGDGSWIFDFGQNFAGAVRLRVEAEAGREITLEFAEMLDDNGELYRANLRSAEARDRYICKGGGPEEWTPRFTFHGFRYVGVRGLPEAPDASALTGLVLHNAMAPTGSFECSSEDINQLNSNIRWGMRSNFLEAPTDCPQRDERLGWTGDAQVFAGAAAFHYDVRTFFEKWMFDLVDGQRGDGAFPDVAPDVLGWAGNAAWGDAGVICPWRMYWHYGDTRILEENYDAMARWIDFQERGASGYLRPRTVYGDWLAIDAVTADGAPVPSDLIGTAYFARTTELMWRIAEALGRADDAEGYAALRREIEAAFQREYVTASGRVVGDCQTAYAISLAFDLLPEAFRELALERLVERIESRDWHLSTGFVGTPLLCPVLSRFGRTDVAYKLLFQDTYPSWLYTVRNGATTMWERWNSYTREGGFGPVEMNSFNHYAYGAVGEWIYATVGGLRAEAPGFREMRVAPEPGGGIDRAKTRLATAAGEAAVEWSLGDEGLRIAFTVPEQANASVGVPPGYSPENAPPEARFGPGDHVVLAPPASV